MDFIVNAFELTAKAMVSIADAVDLLKNALGLIGGTPESSTGSAAANAVPPRQ